MNIITDFKENLYSDDESYNGFHLDGSALIKDSDESDDNLEKSVFDKFIKYKNPRGKKDSDDEEEDVNTRKYSEITAYDDEVIKNILSKFPNSNPNYISPPDSVEVYSFQPPTPPKSYSNITLDSLALSSNDSVEFDVGDGNFDYVSDEFDKTIYKNAWQAITQTNTWDFVSKDIDSFMLSNDPRIKIISDKMEELGYNSHSGVSFGCIMRNMQHLVRSGEKKFKKWYDGTFDTDEVELDRDTTLDPQFGEDSMEYERRLDNIIKKKVEDKNVEKKLMDYMGGY